MLVCGINFTSIKIFMGTQNKRKLHYIKGKK